MSDYIIGLDTITRANRAISLASGPEILLDMEGWRAETKKHIHEIIARTSEGEGMGGVPGIGIMEHIGVPEDVIETIRNQAGRNVGNQVDDLRESLKADVVLKYGDGTYIPLKNARIVSAQEALALV